MLFFGKENVFMCLVAFQKKISENIFWCLEKKKEEAKPRKTRTKPRRTRREIAIGAVLRDRQCDLAKHHSHRSRSREASIGAVLRNRRRDRCFTIDDAIDASWSTVRLWALLFSLTRPQFRKSFEVKIGTEMNFRGQRYYFTVNWKWFSENSIFQINQTTYFTENDFLKPFSPKTNTPLGTWVFFTY